MSTNVKVAKGVAPTRHVPFAAAEGTTLVNYKKASNDCNAEGKPRANACLNCIKAIGQQAEDMPYGRGTTACQEPFSCLINVGFGSGGKVCARCIGLNTACVEVPDAFENQAKALIARMPAFNTAILDRPDMRTDAQKVVISSLIADVKKFAARTENALKAAKKSEATGSPGFGKGAAQGGMLGDQPVTKSEFARLERKIDQLYDMIHEGNKRSFKGTRYARETRNQVSELHSAWNKAALVDEHPMEATEAYALASDEDENDRLQKRKRII